MHQRFAARGDVRAAINEVAHDLTLLLGLYDRQAQGKAPFPPSFALQLGEPKRVQPSRDKDWPHPN